MTRCSSMVETRRGKHHPKPQNTQSTLLHCKRKKLHFYPSSCKTMSQYHISTSNLLRIIRSYTWHSGTELNIKAIQELHPNFLVSKFSEICQSSHSKVQNYIPYPQTDQVCVFSQFRTTVCIRAKTYKPITHIFHSRSHLNFSGYTAASRNLSSAFRNRTPLIIVC